MIKAFVEQLLKQITSLETEVKYLRNQLELDSHNSSEPPSSDKGRKVKSLRQSSEKKPGGQKGRWIIFISCYLTDPTQLFKVYEIY